MPPGTPSARRRAIQPAFDLARRQVDDGSVPFVVLGVAGRDGVVRLESFGPPATERARVGVDAICLLASITKPIVATAVLQLVERGLLDLEVPIGSLAPGLVNPRWAAVTPWHVLTHTAGIEDLDLVQLLQHGASRADLLRHVSKREQVTAPGTHYRYASFTFDLLVEAVAAALGEPFEDQLRAILLEPLGMADTMFDPGADPASARRAAPILVGGWDGATTTEDAGLVDAFTGLHLAGGGLWSTASDLLRFGRAMLRGGELDGERILSPAFVELMTREVTVPREFGWSAPGLGASADPLMADHYALGWGKPGVVTPSSSRAFGHGGVSGTRLWIDPAVDLVYVYLSGSWGMPRTPIDAVEHALYASLT